MPPLRTVFFGTADLACASLARLATSPQVTLPLVVTQPDRPRGRDLRLSPPPVKEMALKLGLSVAQPPRCRAPEFLAELATHTPELIVVAAYGQLLPQALLDLPRYGCLNVHASLLPRYRGAAPIQWAILDDQPETGVTIMRMEAGLDTGPILTQHATTIGPNDDAQSLHDRLATLGAELLLRTIPDYVAGRLQPQPQPAEGVSYARKIVREDGRLDWTRPARELAGRVRGLNPWPGTFTSVPAAPQAELLKVHRCEVVPSATGRPGEILRSDPAGVLVACGQDGLRLLELQRPGGRRLPAAAFLAGHPLPPGTQLGP